jgi:AraC-like DNA-binding protein
MMRELPTQVQDEPATEHRLLLETTVPASVVDELVAGARARGHDTGALELACGIGADRHPKARITLARYLELVKATQLLTQDEILGFSERPMPIGTYLAICHALVQCPTLEAALDLLGRFYGVFVGCPPYRHEGPSVTLCPHSDLQAGSPIFAQSVLLSCYKTLCWLADRRLALAEVGFTGDPHPARDVLGDLFACSPVFGRPVSYLSFEEDVFRAAVVRRGADAGTYGREALVWLLSRAFERRLEQRIRRLIGADLSRGLPPFGVVARRLSMAPQTLSRKLGRSGLTYGQIKDRLRRDAALALLDKTDGSLDEIARAVGFTELSSFSRAFRRWMGMSPGDDRRLQRQAP